MDSEPSSTQTGAHDISDDPPSSAIRLKWDPRVSNGEASEKAGANGIQTEIYLVKILFRRVGEMKLEEWGIIELEKRCCSIRELTLRHLKLG